MRDIQLLDDLASVNYPLESREQLASSGIKSYSGLFAFLRDETSEPDLREKICWAVFALWQSIDRRVAVPALLKTLQSPHLNLRQTAIRTLGQLNSQLAVMPLTDIAQDQSEDIQTRYFAIEALGTIQDKRAQLVLQRIAFDSNENVYVRSAVIEWSFALLFENNDLTPIIKLLSDPEPDIRFWAAFALTNLANCGHDISSALSALDYVVASDHTVPEYWGWHVDREALKALEILNFQPYRQFYIDEDGYEDEISWDMYVISLTPEYDRYLRLYRTFQEDCTYKTKKSPEIDIFFSSSWLKEQLQKQWNPVSFDLRPDSQAFNLSWLTQIDGFNLMGGLHRDGQTVVITGNTAATYQFALWYRSIIRNHDLYLYEWASPGILLNDDMTLMQIKKDIDKQYISFENELKQAR